MKISEHLTLAELTTSQTAERKKIDNTPSKEVIENLTYTALNVFEPIRKHFNTPIRVSSGYRSVKLNKAIGGAATSQHCLGQALDLQGTGSVSNADIYNFVKKTMVFDQLIWEFGTDLEPSWVHVSIKKEGKNRKQIIRVK